MQVIGWALAVGVTLFVAGAQNPQRPDGPALFRERCADCHGADAKGDRGPDVTRLWMNDGADERAMKTIRTGVAGSIMPPSSAPDEEIRAIVAYLRSISVAKTEAISGNATSGEAVFAANCAQCHRINGRGGYLGPDLSRIAGSQSNQVLTRAIRDASASFASGYEPVTLVTRDGRQIRGTRKAEDAFSIQIMDLQGRLRGFEKGDLREVTRDRKSLMPDFGTDRLPDSSLDDLLAYLAKFRIPPARRAADTPGDGK